MLWFDTDGQVLILEELDRLFAPKQTCAPVMYLFPTWPVRIHLGLYNPCKYGMDP